MSLYRGCNNFTYPFYLSISINYNIKKNTVPQFAVCSISLAGNEGFTQIQSYKHSKVYVYPECERGCDILPLLPLSLFLRVLENI